MGRGNKTTDSGVTTTNKGDDTSSQGENDSLNAKKSNNENEDLIFGEWVK